MSFTSEKTQKVYDKFKENDKYKCAYCGFEIFTDADVDNDFKLTMDHVKPIAKGGTDALANLVPCCFKCNHIKDDMDIEEFRNALLSGKIENRKKNKELTELKTTRYMIPYGRYTGMSGYMWGGKFYFEKTKTEKKTVADMIGIVQPMQMKNEKPSEIIDNFFKESPTTIKASTSEGRVTIDSITADKQNEKPKKIINKNIIIVSGDVSSKTAAKKTITEVKKTADKPVKVVAKSTISRTERKALYSEYDYKCAYCGCELLCDTKEYGHANACPSRLNPTDGYIAGNCVASCHECENIKGKSSLEEFRKIVFPDTPHRKERLMRFIERNYRAFPVKKFYFELTSLQRIGVDDYWARVDQRDVSGKHIIAGTTIREIKDRIKAKQTVPKPVSVPKIETPDINTKIDTEALTKPLMEQYEELNKKRIELIANANLLGDSMMRIKQAIKAIESANSENLEEPDIKDVMKLLV